MIDIYWMYFRTVRRNGTGYLCIYHMFVFGNHVFSLGHLSLPLPHSLSQCDVFVIVAGITRSVLRQYRPDL